MCDFVMRGGLAQVEFADCATGSIFPLSPFRVKKIVAGRTGICKKKVWLLFGFGFIRF
jgi:hypothetical protein